ncbi:MAG TPA: hypothetical protein EYN06_04410 [Myxococcales bacterium]|nr:hypothetical protein [Myxococcales bacterium]
MFRNTPILAFSMHLLLAGTFLCVSISCDPVESVDDVVQSDTEVTPPTSCADPFPIWSAEFSSCVQCQDDTHCSIGYCNLDSGDCMACFDDSHCAKGVCVKQAKGGFQCRDCTEDSHCIEIGTGEYCDLQTQKCQGCTIDKQCDDDNVCTLNACVNGECTVKDADISTPCDGGECTKNGNCLAGACVAEVVSCQCELNSDCLVPKELSKQCTKVGCVKGECAFSFGTQGCEDGNKCTTGEICDQGVCSAKDAEDVVCDDGNSCTLSKCDPAKGCMYSPVNDGVCDDGNPCTEGDLCNDGVCAGKTEVICDDGNPCTLDTCLQSKGCDSKPAKAKCSDNDPCTLEDECADGVCVPGPKNQCDDGNPCTKDWCSEGKGCAHSFANGNTCNDGNACTKFDQCNSGQCAGDQVTCDAAAPKKCAGECKCPAIICASGQEPVDTNNDKCPDSCDASCVDVCDCYENKQLSLDKKCMLNCPICTAYWACSAGKCVEKCESTLVGELDCDSKIECDSEKECVKGEYCQKPDNGCALTGQCSLLPTKCSETVAWVCGCDGSSYTNSCIAAIAGINVAAVGACNCPAINCTSATAPVDTTGDGCPDSCSSSGCKSNLECGVGKFCYFSPSLCSGPGICIATDDDLCLKSGPFEICGCDGKTYDDYCAASAVGVNIQAKGPCELECKIATVKSDCGIETFCELPIGVCSGEQGACVLDADLCVEGDNPVCGCDMKSYANDCERQKNKVQKLKDGKCECAKQLKCADGFYGVDTTKDGCPDACWAKACKSNSHCGSSSLLFCDKKVGDCQSVGECAFLDKGDLCPKDFEPVCGCDGVTYENVCAAEQAGTSVALLSPCDQ